MPRTGMEPVRRAALIEATIEEVGQSGALDVTVAQIARRAGVSSALAHHYFGGKSQIFLAAMRHILKLYGASVRNQLAGARTPRDRLKAIVRASFEPANFRRDVIAAWMNFYVQAQVSADVRRLLTLYQKRLRSNLLHELRPLAGPRAPMIADTLAALIDGIYIRAALAADDLGGEEAADRTIATLDLLLESE
ncbi:choline-binding transcriptional repressor BetI [Histidinibacterium aquaticum]|uniref:HTH-type transcriptional regulator BetI n=1 Tax=Histidinibacterium aquaticum TaxID=2613962 RepID=A0A5J5GGX8_9RHOB|nr:transcriptional regulator BetI [Histidinibacterium aquaticum]KAA9006784.1 transcriptional regulator BetI [Histidinibacterium aquaticum]